MHRDVCMAKIQSKGVFGIAEWFGELYANLGQIDRQRLLFATAGDKKRANMLSEAEEPLKGVLASQPEKLPCRFMADSPELAPQAGTHCNKSGGVCSIRSFNDSEEGVQFGAITATCPNRFLEGRLIIETIGQTLLGTREPLIAKEIPFLRRVSATAPASEAEGSEASETNGPVGDKEDVGRIDMVCAHPDLDQLNWCAVELQAVYFSGGAMSKDFTVISAHEGNDIPMPGAKNRRPDYRSSGPKRLMPQLQIKVPTLRRWGKKMAVVVDEPFFQSLGPMDNVDHVSNSDIIWVIVRFTEKVGSGSAEISIADIRYTTLERAVEGLTAGVPTTLPEFEVSLSNKLSKKSNRRRNKTNA